MVSYLLYNTTYFFECSHHTLFITNVFKSLAKICYYSVTGHPNEKPWLAVWVAWGGLASCNGRWSRGTCVFGVKDLPSLISRPEFMLNKFDMKFDPLALECMGRWIEYKTACPQSFDEDFYKQLPFIIKS